jgi:protein-S-isoprenylcysteine O-methyltransferase Ste14
MPAPSWNFAKIGRGTPAPIDAPKKLVVTGLHRYMRNPMYLGVLLVLLGELILFPSRPFAIYILFFFALVNAFVLLYEEPTLKRMFGEEYERYKRAVPRWIPTLRSPTTNRS